MNTAFSGAGEAGTGLLKGSIDHWLSSWPDQTLPDCKVQFPLTFSSKMYRFKIYRN